MRLFAGDNRGLGPANRRDQDHYSKQPHFIYRRDRKLICFAGVMAMYTPAGKDSLLTCALLTRDAPPVAMIHDQMPVVAPWCVVRFLAGSGHPEVR